MSKTEETASDVAQDDQEENRVYDFLYHDSVRVGSVLAQLDPSGHLTGLKQTEAAESTTSSKAGASAGVTAVIARGGTNFEGQHGATERETAERSYDPTWVNALEMLVFLEARGLENNTPGVATLGSFAMAEGSLVILDAALMKAALAVPSIKKLAENQSRAIVKGLTKNQQEVASKTAYEQTRLMFDILGILPHGVQVQVISGNYTVWANLDERFMVTSPSDLMLKHGISVSGSWKIVGILDAVPDNMSLSPAISFPGGPVIEMLSNLYPVARSLFGRPEGAFGMTPILIYREIIR